MTSSSGSVDLEGAVGPGAPGVDDALGDALVVEVHDLLAEVEVLQQGRAAGAGRQRVVGVVDRDAALGGEASPRWRPRRRQGVVAGGGPLGDAFAARSRSGPFASPFLVAIGLTFGRRSSLTVPTGLTRARPSQPHRSG